MSINRLAIKHNSKLLLSSSKPSPFLVVLVYYIIIEVLNFLTGSVSGQTAIMNEMMRQYQNGNFNFVPTIPTPTITASLLIIAISLMMLMISTGFSIYCYNVCSGRKGSYGNLFDAFAIFGKVFLLNLLMAVFIYLWALLFIIPGIIAAYRYRQALYIMLDHPEYSALECIRESKKMMNGRKGELFVLDLSFLGWNLLTVIPFVSIFVIPYTNFTYVNYYLALRDMPSPDGEGELPA